ncbi:MAG: lipoyl synthase, partial [Candidatus Krumholzibacteria bacterium]|nr:lipoyl synthase [Candidatus Krumholzibacteria bacterium]
QYLRPGMEQVPVERYIPPERFVWFEKEALKAGFRDVAAGPLVRSSYQEVRLDPRGRRPRSEGLEMRGGTT